MANLKWLLIIAGMLAGVFIPWQLQVVMMAVLLMGYIVCFKPKWLGFQIALESLFGGLATGLGLQFLIAFGSKNRVIEMILMPLATWLLLRIIFYGLETKYTLSPNAAITQIRSTEDNTQNSNAIAAGTSAWAGDNAGQATIADADGRYMRYEYFTTGEIAMGGPTYGDVIFNNSCAFRDVGPSIVVSDDGRYAAMTLPSRDQWGLLIADLRDKRIYEINDSSFWEIDHIENNIIYGRHSPITSNTVQQLSITQAIQTANPLTMVQDDGWWVIDYPNREPFKHYKAVTISSKQNKHKVTFVPDLKPFKNNPFLRNQHPIYTVLVDDTLMDIDTACPVATWVSGQADDSVQDDRFLVLSSQIIDFKDKNNNVFSIENRTVLPFIKGCDENTNISFEYGELSNANDGFLLAKAYVLPRSTGWDSAEYEAYSNISPWDEEAVTYWDINQFKRSQQRTRIKRYVEYKIDLDQYSQLKDEKNCALIKLENRGNANHTAHLMYANQTDTLGGYSCYQLTTSCGITLINVLHEAIWSHCGRYLAVVQFELPPLVPNKISIIDFKTSTLKNIIGSYALPSFIWFDQNMLDFTHLIGVDEHLIVGQNQRDESHLQLRLTEPVHAANPYALLIGGIEQRRSLAEQHVASKKHKTEYASATVNKIAQHCLLFAPEFDTAVLQPPIHTR